jgi:hypothetical protein
MGENQDTFIYSNSGYNVLYFLRIYLWSIKSFDMKSFTCESLCLMVYSRHFPTHFTSCHCSHFPVALRELDAQPVLQPYGYIKLIQNIRV